MPFCPNCGKSIGEEDRFCRACGYELARLAHRPKEIGYLMPLHTIQSLFLLGWLWLLVAMGSAPRQFLNLNSFGLTIVSIGIVYLILAYGYRKRRGWARNLGIMFPLLEIALVVINLSATRLIWGDL